MRKKRILFCSEATFLNTGYATYAREILNYLHSTGKYELAEMASYGIRNDPRAAGTPWKFFGVQPPENAPKEEHDQYHASPVHQFGEFAFERVCLEFQPDIVCDIRDFWMLDFAERSPFRKFFKWCIMPTVDAAPQARQWIATYQSADACFTYSDWAGDVLKEQTGGKINYLGSSPPSAHPAYRPMDKIQCRTDFQIPTHLNIIGTVMRNQRRKLYPDLFAAFRRLLDTCEHPSMYALYCHTGYPDLGWDIPELLQQYELSSYVWFTYICHETGRPFASLFKGPFTQSPFTGTFGSQLSNVRTGLSYEDLAKVMNCFDLYVQYANCEGFGLPQVEAAACGVPVMGTDYSAMESVLRNLKGFPIKPKALYKELETGCYRAVPDNDLAADHFHEFFDLPEEDREIASKTVREQFLRYYQWDKSGKKWEDYFDSVDILPDEQTWKSPHLDIQRPEPMPTEFPPQTTAADLARWLIINVLKSPEKANSFLESRIVRDLLYRSVTASVGGIYENEMSSMFVNGQAQRMGFNVEQAYNHMVALRNKINYWEDQRRKVFGL